VTRPPNRGRERVTLLPSVLAVGFVSVVCGMIIANLVGVTDTPGSDWAELGILALALCVGLALLAYRRRRFQASRRR
jgi:membrane protein implicated in regulation of membrane protease activity